MALQTGDIVLGKYRIEELIGQGGRSSTEVYRALHTDLLVYRALKIVNGDDPALEPACYFQIQQCFQSGAQYGARLNHPNIIQIHDFAHDGNGRMLVLVMEYAPGGNLAERLRGIHQSGRMMSVSECVRIAREMAEGLTAIHALDVVHRDLKPSNILFDAQGRAKVSDLGLAQVPSGMSMLSQIGQVGFTHPGTPAYMSPEQKSSTDYLSPASDVYTLGLILFEMLTGRIYRHVRPGTRPSNLRSITPRWLDDLVGRMLADLPQDRTWDGAEVAAALRQESQNKQTALAAQVGESITKPAESVGQQNEAPPAFLTQKRPQAVAPAPEAALSAQPGPSHRSDPTQPEPPLPTEEPNRLETGTAHQHPALASEAPFDLIQIPAGPFLMGSADSDDLATDDEKPQHEMILTTYRIGRYPVTCADYLRFVTETGYGWRWGEARNPERATHPAVVVNWYDACTFCEWLNSLWRAEGRISGNELVRLPTEAEWEKAARGTDGRIWPWGSEPPDASRLNFCNTDTDPVASHSPRGDSPYGAVDMAGNVWEWTINAWGDAVLGEYAYPYMMTDGRENLEASGSVQRVLRGGSFYNTVAAVRCTTRYRLNPGYDSRGIGFRIVVAPVLSAPST